MEGTGSGRMEGDSGKDRMTGGNVEEGKSGRCTWKEVETGTRPHWVLFVRKN